MKSSRETKEEEKRTKRKKSSCADKTKFVKENSSFFFLTLCHRLPAVARKVRSGRKQIMNGTFSINYFTGFRQIRRSRRLSDAPFICGRR